MILTFGSDINIKDKNCLPQCTFGCSPPPQSNDKMVAFQEGAYLMDQEFDGKGLTPYDPAHNSTYILAGKNFTIISVKSIGGWTWENKWGEIPAFTEVKGSLFRATAYPNSCKIANIFNFKIFLYLQRASCTQPPCRTSPGLTLSSTKNLWEQNSTTPKYWTVSEVSRNLGYKLQTTNYI